MKKIIYICYIPLTKAMVTDYHIQYLLDNNVLVEYWDVTALYFPDFVIPDRASGEYIKGIPSFPEFKKMLEKEDLKNTVFIVQITYGFNVVRLFRFLTKKRCFLLFFRFYSYPAVKRSKQETMTKILRSILVPKQYIRNGQRLIAHYAKKLKLIKHFDMVFCADQAGINQPDENSRVIRINFFDYDHFLRCRKNNSALLDNPYCVFLDSNLANHPDLQVIKGKSIDPERYYETLNRYFKALEHRYHIEVVIAAHPKANYAPNPFEGRRIFWYKPNELVQHCEFVLTFGSFSISYAVLHKKSILFLTSDEIFSCFNWFFNETQACAASLGLSVKNIDQISVVDTDIPPVNAEKYVDYKYRYLTSKETENRLSGEIVYEALATL